ncbi:putative cyclase [Cristinia sonorae]|uniref:Cyclase n=1 Tax=Cristinia sonorae TaxID=1940300 RepID=A0A8K0UU81_9AGAR|nr:putative cyclase [Cristinia sonorae]
MTNKVVDLTQTLEDKLSIYPGDPSFACRPFLTIPKDGLAVVAINLGSHTGTHIDAPSHFIDGGATVDQIPLEKLVGPAVVIDLDGKVGKRQIIGWDSLKPWESEMKEAVHKQVQRYGSSSACMVLIRTGWDRYWGEDTYFDHPFLSSDAASRILELGVTLIGIDTLSPDETLLPSQNAPEPHGDFGVHQAVLGAGHLIVENLTNLGSIVDGEWTVSLLPLKIGGCDGSPIRACAWRRIQ